MLLNLKTFKDNINDYCFNNRMVDIKNTTTNIVFFSYSKLDLLLVKLTQNRIATIAKS